MDNTQLIKYKVTYSLDVIVNSTTPLGYDTIVKLAEEELADNVDVYLDSATLDSVHVIAPPIGDYKNDGASSGVDW